MILDVIHEAQAIDATLGISRGASRTPWYGSIVHAAVRFIFGKETADLILFSLSDHPATTPHIKLQEAA